MGHPSSNAVLNFDRLWVGGLAYRIGLQIQSLDQWSSSSEPPEPSPKPPDRARNVRLQVASPPPRRLDDSNWYDGLLVNDGSENGRAFHPEDDSWRRFGVFALKREDGGPENLRPPKPETLIFDKTIAVPLIDASAQRSTATTLLRSGEPVIEEADHFLSVYYDLSSFTGVRLPSGPVTFAYHTSGVLDFTLEPGAWVAFSLDAFAPDNRTSADYIAQVDPESSGPPPTTS